MNWDNITLAQFQEIEKVNSRKDLPDLDKAFLSTCIVFKMSPKEFDNLADKGNRGVKKAVRLTEKVSQVFTTKIEEKPFKRIGKYFVDYDMSKITYGQYVELAYFLQSPINNAHYVMASVSRLPFFKNNPKQHRRKADYFLQNSVRKIIGAVYTVIDNLKEFNKEYSALFGIDQEVSGDVQEDFFNKRYGWQYSASAIAEYERIPLDDVYSLPIRQALGDLVFLKAKAKYEHEQSKKVTNGR